MTRRERYARREDLTPPAKRALIVLLEDGSVTKQANYWSGPSGRKIRTETILAIYDRYLIKIVTESRHRKLQTAKLTDVGEYAAQAIQREVAYADGEKLKPKPLTEDAQRFIVEVVG